jgi:hypothetical protein
MSFALESAVLEGILVRLRPLGPRQSTVPEYIDAQLPARRPGCSLPTRRSTRTGGTQRSPAFEVHG